MSKKLGIGNPLEGNALFSGFAEDQNEEKEVKKTEEPAKKQAVSTGNRKYNFETGPIPKKETKTRRIQATCAPSLYEAFLDVARRSNEDPSLSFNEALSMAMSEYVMRHQG